MNKVLMHIAGPSGSGKTTLLQRIEREIKDVIPKDLDDFDNEASELLQLDSVNRSQWSDDDYMKLAKKREELMNQFVEASESPIIFAGSNREGSIVIDVPTVNKYLIDVDAGTSAHRAYERSQTERPEHRRTLEELPFDIKEAEEEIEFYVSQGYVKKTAEEIFKLVADATKFV